MLKSALHQRISNHTVISYTNLLDPLRALYEDPANSNNIILEYSLTSVDKNSTSWNREHLWPRARGDSDQAGPDDSDLFHVVPSDSGVNAERGNLYFDESNPSDPGYVIPGAPGAPQTSRDSDSWQPPPAQRGAIARALFYMEVRYDGSDPNTTDMELVSFPPSGSQMANLNTLLLWNEQYPPDDAERRRNDLIYSNYQHNRNPFIDHPEWVQAIWGTGTSNGGGTQPIAQVTTLSSSAVETPNTPATIQVSLNQFAGSTGVTVAFTMTGTASLTDFSVTGPGVTYDANTGMGTVLIPANFNSTVVSIVPVADSVAEPTEIATMNLSTAAGYTVVPGTSASVSITDAPGLPASWNFDSGAPYANPLPANNGNAVISFSNWTGSVTSFGGTTGQALALVGTTGNNSSIDFNFSMSGFGDLSITFSTRGTSTGYTTGTWSYSTDGANFTAMPGVNTATTGTNFVSRSVNFSSISVLDDAPNVTLRYTLSGATGSAGNNRIDDFTIHATPFASGSQLRTVEVAASDASASETNSDPGLLAFRINGVANPGGLLVNFHLSGTATGPGQPNADFNLTGIASYDSATHSGTILIPEGSSTALATVTPIPDDIVEGTETVIATIDSQADTYIVGQNSSALISIAEPPPNDAFVHAIPLAGSTLTTTGTNVGATKESGEPNHAGLPGGKSVWWNWTAPSNGSVTISTTNSNFDTLLGVYTGSAVNALTLVANDTNSGGHTTSAVRFATIAGTTYYIAVDGYNAASGNISLAVTASANPPVRPANDNLANAVTLSGGSVTALGNNDYATKEIGEPNHAGIAGGKSVWWRWTAVLSGSTTISTSGSNFDTLLAVYTGSDVNALSLVAANNDFSGTASQVTFIATVGVTYAIAVDGNNASSGTVSLRVTGFAPAPPNDNFANAITLSGAESFTTGTNTGATKETGEPNHDNISGGKSVWWRWTAPSTGSMIVDTIGSNFDTVLAVYTGTAVNALTAIAGDDDSGGNLNSKVTINVVAGTTYQIAVDGYGGNTGNISLNVHLPPTAPGNDNFANAYVLTGDAPTATGNNFVATKEALEPAHNGFSGGHSVWWRWVSPHDGYASISTAGSNFDTVLAVYTGTSVGALTPVASNDQANGTNQSQVVFPVTAGVEYEIAVDGFVSTSVGNIVLAINGPLPLPTASVFSLSDSPDEKTGEPGYFYVTIDAPQPNPVTVLVNLGGTATPGVDYTIDSTLNGTTAVIIIPAGQTFALVTITPVTDDDASEFDETIIPSLLASEDYATGSSPAATITLRDNTPYNAAWAQQFVGFTGPNTDPLADFNGNGVVNLLEFAFNGNPVSGNLGGQNGVPLLPVVGFGQYADPNDNNTVKSYPTITFTRRTDAPQLIYEVQTSTTLQLDSWDSLTAVQVDATTAGMPAGTERATYRSGQPAVGLNAVTPQFLRVKVSLAP